jgi:hypothetical protein
VGAASVRLREIEKIEAWGKKPGRRGRERKHLGMQRSEDEGAGGDGQE